MKVCLCVRVCIFLVICMYTVCRDMLFFPGYYISGLCIWKMEKVVFAPWHLSCRSVLFMAVSSFTRALGRNSGELTRVRCNTNGCLATWLVHKNHQHLSAKFSTNQKKNTTFGGSTFQVSSFKTNFSVLDYYKH